MHCPAPLAWAVAATLVQFICSMFIVAGFYTLIIAALSGVAPGGAILRNLLSDHDPKLALLYKLVAVTLACVGGGRFSLDAFVLSKPERQPANGVQK